MDSCLLHICRMGDSIAHNYFYSTVFVVVVSIGLELSQKHVLLFATYHPVACFLFSGCCWLCNCVGDILGWVFLLTMSMPLRPLFSRIMEHAIKLKKNPNNCFCEHDHELTEVKCWSHQIRCGDVIMSVWTNIRSEGNREHQQPHFLCLIKQSTTTQVVLYHKLSFICCTL